EIQMTDKKQRREQMTVEDFGADVIAAMDAEFHHESDRIVAIVGAAYLDSSLDALFRAALNESPEEVDKMLRPEGILGSNGSRYQLAYCLGLIKKDQWDDLKTVAKIRNRFAHDYRMLSFDSEPIRDLCSNLHQPGLFLEMTKRMFPDKDEPMDYVKQITKTSR